MIYEKIFDTLDCFLIVFITFLAIVTRVWIIYNPDSITFDEVYFGNFTNYYINRTFFYDIHPPLAKLTMAFFAYCSGYKGTIDFSANQSEHYKTNDIHYITLRLTPAIFQSFCFPLVYSSLKCFNFKSFTALSASIALLFEPSMMTEGRFILSDGVLHFYVCLHIFALSLYLRSHNSKFIYFAALTLGAAISCKHTALGLVAFDIVTQIIWIFRYHPTFKEIFQRILEFFIPMMTVFYVSFLIHYFILIYDGPGSIRMPECDQITFLKKGSYNGNLLLGPPLMSRILVLNILMFSSHSLILTAHPYESRPQYWPFLFDKVICFSSFPNHTVMCIGSPLIYWPATTFIIITFVCLIFFKLDLRHLILFSGWAFSYFPFFLIPRSMYLYHYLIPLIFSVMCQSATIETLFYKNPYIRLLLQWLMVFFGITSYIWWYPFIYGTECIDCFSIREWLWKWSLGPSAPLFSKGSA